MIEPRSECGLVSRKSANLPGCLDLNESSAESSCQWRGAVLVSLLAVFLVLFMVACKRGAREGHGLLPPPPAGQLPVAGGEPTAPFDQQLAKGVLARSVLRTPGPSDTEIQIRDIIVGPHAETRLETLPGMVIVDVRSGTGSLSVGTKTMQLSMQQPVSLQGGETGVLRGGDRVPLALRLYVVKGK
jgi:hypothetical protein